MPFSLSEEFVAVYRMHPLMRDNIEVYDIGSNLVSRTIPLQNAIDREAENLLAAERPERLWYSFGITNPGSLTLNNYPGFLRDLSLPLVATSTWRPSMCCVTGSAACRATTSSAARLA